MTATIVDTSALLVLFDSDEPRHQDASDFFAAQPGPFVVSPYVVAEVDYLVATRFGVAAELSVLRELSSGAWHLADMGVTDLASATAVVERYRDQSIGIADASLVVLAARHRTTRIATLDHRHFSVLRSLDGEPFSLILC
jgi:hypothetical protein